MPDDKSKTFPHEKAARLNRREWLFAAAESSAVRDLRSISEPRYNIGRL